jgi:hypothetical protein
LLAKKPGLTTTEPTSGSPRTRSVNQSELTTFMRCPRKWHLSYLQGWQEVHLGLELHYKGRDYADAFPVEGVDIEAWGEEENLSWLMLEGYMEWLEETGVDSDWTIEMVEQRMELPLGNIGGLDVTLFGTVDWVARDGLGRLLITDHKTVKAFGALVDRRLQLSFQLLTYAWMYWQTTGIRPDGVMLNMLRKVKRTAAAKPPFYAREEVHFNEAQLVAHGRHIRQIVAAMLQAESEGWAYPVPDQDCTWKCPFMSLCPLMDDGSDSSGALTGLFVQRDRG